MEDNEKKNSMWGEPLPAQLKFCLVVISIFAAWSFFTVMSVITLVTPK